MSVTVDRDIAGRRAQQLPGSRAVRIAQSRVAGALEPT